MTDTPTLASLLAVKCVGRAETQAGLPPAGQMYYESTKENDGGAGWPPHLGGWSLLEYSN